MIIDKPRIRQRVNRNGFTLNNPFLTDVIKVVDINNLTDEQKAMPRIEHDYTFLRQPQFESLVEFAFVEYKQNEIKNHNETARQVIGERVFFKNYDCAKEFFKLIDYIDYFCFQYEKGESGNLHLQGFIHYSRSMDMKVVHKIYPTISLNPCGTLTNSECIEYCQKKGTSIEGYGFYSHGEQPADERTRTDMNELRQDIADCTPYDEMFKKYTWLMIQSGDKILKAQQKHKQQKFKNTVRQVYVTYIYGKERAGKTTYPERVLGYEPMEIGLVGDYNTTGMFDEYESQDLIVFDEFDSQVEITKMNKYLDGRPCALPARNYNRVACYTKVFIISNYPLDYHYRKARADGKEPSYRGFVERINEIIYMPDRNVYIWQKGQPTAEILAALDEQGAKHRIDSPTEQVTMKGVI